MLEDSITPLERQLYFTTAHAHFKAGCPALALEVLSKLPNKVMDTNCDDTPSKFDVLEFTPNLFQNFLNVKFINLESKFFNVIFSFFSQVF